MASPRASELFNSGAGAILVFLPIEGLLLRQEIEDFLYREAELLDARRYREWLEQLVAFFNRC